MRLSELLAELPDARLTGDGDVNVTSVCYDSREATQGCLFVAVPGLKTDGHDYIRQALARGASGVVVQGDRESSWRPALRSSDIPCVSFPDTRSALAQLAAAIEGRPGRRMAVVGVTGTDGKTSLSHLIAHVFQAAGHKTGLISTAECRSGLDLLPDTGRFTTPEATQVQAMLRTMLTDGCAWAIVEATSHGLALHRLDGCEFDIAVLTNIGSDHMDFHGTVEEYMAAKGRLFRMLDESAPKNIAKTAILNADDPASGYFKSLSRARVVTYALRSAADISVSEMSTDGWSTRFRLKTPVGEVEAYIARPGDFNVQNALAAAGVALTSGLPLEAISRAIESWPGAPGRLELIDEGQPFTVVVDFAHAPDSLRRVLRLLRSRVRGRIIAVFGCIGERDKDRRFPMGQVAAAEADFTILSDDNPYTEERMQVLRDIAAGLAAVGRREGHDFAIIPDRREAIHHALSMAVDEDGVLLAGRGHETRVYLPEGSYECDDREEARRVLRSL